MKKQQGFGIVALLLIIVILGVIVATGWLLERSRQKSTTKSSDQKIALMIVTSSGGVCPNGPCTHPQDHLYDDGSFEAHKKLNISEVAELKKVIATTDFLKYASNPQPTPAQCPSLVDGSDQVLLFPQKYGNKTFIPCRLVIPTNDPTFMFINHLLDSH